MIHVGETLDAFFFFFSQILTILFLRPYRVPYFSLHPFMFSKENQERRDESSSGWAFGHRRGGRNLSFREIGPCVAAPDRKKGEGGGYLFLL